MAERRRYTKRQKATAVIAAEMASVAAASEQTGIPRTTLTYWMDDPEFVAIRQKTREDMADESKALAHKTLAVIKSKLGDFEPRDLTVLFGVLVDKSQLLTGHATNRTETKDLTDSLDDHERDILGQLLREVTEGVHAGD